jgi:hypothetical protein
MWRICEPCKRCFVLLGIVTIDHKAGSLREQKCRYAESAHFPTFSAISPADQPVAMKKNVWQQHKIMVGQTRDPD